MLGRQKGLQEHLAQRRISIKNQSKDLQQALGKFRETDGSFSNLIILNKTHWFESERMNFCFHSNIKLLVIVNWFYIY